MMYLPDKFRNTEKESRHSKSFYIHTQNSDAETGHRYEENVGIGFPSLLFSLIRQTGLDTKGQKVQMANTELWTKILYRLPVLLYVLFLVRQPRPSDRIHHIEDSASCS
jgi:hypothetical protein